MEGTDFRCATAVSHVISADTGLPEDQAMLVATVLTGMAQTAARYWLRQQGRIPRDQASQIVSVLAWRGSPASPRPTPANKACAPANVAPIPQDDRAGLDVGFRCVAKAAAKNPIEVKIGVQYSPREISVEVTQTADEVRALVEQAVADGSTIHLTDIRGRQLLVPATTLSYVEIGPSGLAGSVSARTDCRSGVQAQVTHAGGVRIGEPREHAAEFGQVGTCPRATPIASCSAATRWDCDNASPTSRLPHSDNLLASVLSSEIILHGGDHECRMPQIVAHLVDQVTGVILEVRADLR